MALADRVLIMESGRFTLEISVDLPQPRVRGQRDFITLKEEALSHLLTRAAD